MSAPDRSLRWLARLYGVQISYHDIEGTLRRAASSALIDTLRALGAPLGDPPDVAGAVLERKRELWGRGLTPVVVAWDGCMPALTLRRPADDAGDLTFELRLEDGARRTWTATSAQREPRGTRDVGGRRWCVERVRPPWDLPLGYHVLRAGERRTTLVISAPLEAAGPGRRGADGGASAGAGGRLWGAFLPLYSLETERSWGTGDLTDLGTLMQWVGAAGGSLVGTLPLLAAFLDEPFEPSPYSPVSRLFWNELYADVSETRELDACPDAKAVLSSNRLEDRIREARDEDLIDYPERYRDRRGVLDVLATCFFRDGGEATDEFAEFIESYPDAPRYARFRAVCERRREPWRCWPAPLRDGSIDKGDYDEAAYRTHLYAQLLMHRQLSKLREASKDAGARLYLDLPIGVHSDGYDVWAYRGLFARGVSAGAPPDPFISKGQDWGFPPLRPTALRERHHAYFIRAIRTHLRYAGALRLDHVMSLHRLFWVPHGRPPTEGVYVRYPADELYAILTLESRRRGAFIIGEDLGTVPAAVRRAMELHGLRRMWIGQFEFGLDPDQALPLPAARSIAALNTHDMPPFAAWWRGDDIEERRALGWLDDEAADRDRHHRARQRDALAERLRRDGDLDPDPPPSARRVHESLLAWLARCPAEIVLVNLEDLWGETRSQNVPGTWRERPNWRRKAGRCLEEFVGDDDVAAEIRILERN